MEIVDGVFNLSTKKVSPLTLIYLKSNNKVLLLKRSVKKEMVAGEWLGLGGKLEFNESLVDSAKREFYEETGLKIKNPVLRGTFTWIDQSEYAGVLYIFLATEYEGELAKDCNEGELSWHTIDSLDKLENLAVHQKFFLSKVLNDTECFYSGIATYKDGKLVTYADSEKYFKDREITIKGLRDCA